MTIGNDYLKISAAAKEIGFSPAILRNAIKTGELPAVAVGKTVMVTRLALSDFHHKMVRPYVHGELARNKGVLK